MQAPQVPVSGGCGGLEGHGGGAAARQGQDLAHRRAAAERLQAAWRGARERRQVARRRAAAVLVQATWRGTLAWRALKDLNRHRPGVQRQAA
jgi:hypothetical protein